MKNRIKLLLKEQGRTMKDVAEQLGTDGGSLSRAIAGNPKLSTIQGIASALNVEVYQLFTDSIPSREPGKDIHGVIWIGGKPNLINSMKDIEDLLLLAKMGQSLT